MRVEEAERLLENAKDAFEKAKLSLKNAKKELVKAKLEHERDLKSLNTARDAKYQPKHAKIRSNLFATKGVKDLGGLGLYFWDYECTESYSKLIIINKGLEIPSTTEPAKSYYIRMIHDIDGEMIDCSWFVDGERTGVLDTSLIRVGDVITFDGYRDCNSHFVTDTHLIPNDTYGSGYLDVPLEITRHTRDVLTKYKYFLEWGRIGRFTLNSFDKSIIHSRPKSDSLFHMEGFGDEVEISKAT